MTRYLLAFVFLFLLLSRCGTDSSSAGADDKNLRYTYFEDGKTVRQKYRVANGTRHGLLEQFYKSGELHTTVMFNCGMKVGDAVWYYKTGPKYRATPYVNGKKEGMQMGFFEDGTVKFEMPFFNGEPISGLKEYNNSGQLKEAPHIEFNVFQQTNEGQHETVVRGTVIPDYKRIDFYRGPLEDGALPQGAQKVKGRKGVCDIIIKQNGTITRVLPISSPTLVAKVYTSMKNCYLIEATYEGNK